MNSLDHQQKESLVRLIVADPHLTQEEKKNLIQGIHTNQPWFSSLLAAGLGLAVAKFLNLSSKAQILLTIAGYGIGKYLLDNSKKSDKLLQYNEKLKTYELMT